MNATVKTNLAGVLVMLLASQGIELSPEDQTALVGLLGGLGCVINIGLAIWSKRRVK